MATLEERLRALPGLQEELNEIYLDVIGVGGGPLTFETLERCAHWAAVIGAEIARPIGESAGYARGRAEAFEEAAKEIEDRVSNEHVRLSLAHAIRALKSSTTREEKP